MHPNGGQGFGDQKRSFIRGWLRFQQMERFCDQTRDLVAWIETAVRVLEHDLHLATHSKVRFFAHKNGVTIKVNLTILHVLKPQNGAC